MHAYILTPDHVIGQVGFVIDERLRIRKSTHKVIPFLTFLHHSFYQVALNLMMYSTYILSMKQLLTPMLLLFFNLFKFASYISF